MRILGLSEGYEARLLSHPIAGKFLQVLLKPQGYAKLPSRPFVMPCRPICGMDLRRPHFTCMFLCRLRLVHSKKIPPLIELEYIHRIYVRKRRRFRITKNWLLKKLILPIAEALAN